jgi:HEAT repeat protein
MKPFLLLAGIIIFFSGCSIELPQEESTSPAVVQFEPISSQPKPDDRSTPVVEQFDSIDSGLAMLVSSSESGDKQQQMAAYTWLCSQGPSAVTRVAGAMNDSSLPIEARRHACRVLGHLGPTATAPLIAASRSDNITLKLRAIETLPAVDPPQKEIVDRLIVLLNDPSQQVQTTAIRSLGYIGPPAKRSADPLVALRDNINLSETVRHEAGRSLKLVRPIRSFED